jgi:hypothetical protein
MSSHLLLLLIFSLLVSTVFAALLRETVREQLALGVRIFAGFVGAAVLLGWLMFPFPF